MREVEVARFVAVFARFAPTTSTVWRLQNESVLGFLRKGSREVYELDFMSAMNKLRPIVRTAGMLEDREDVMRIKNSFLRGHGRARESGHPLCLYSP